MRIISGSARGMHLDTLDGDATRPTAERVKEAVFSMIQFDIEGRSVLDLFAGSGQMGLEALSRGASKAAFVDSSLDAVNIIKKNAQKTKLYEKCRVLNSDCKLFVKGVSGHEKFDIVFIDPPYASGLVPDVLKRISEFDVVNVNGFVICESDSDKLFVADGFSLHRHNKYGKVYITVLIKNEDDINEIEKGSDSGQL